MAEHMIGYAKWIARKVREAYDRGDDVCPLELLDAAHEDANGRLPHEAGYVDPRTTLPARRRVQRRRAAQKRRKAA